MKKALLAIALVVLFIGATTISAGVDIEPEKQQCQLKASSNKPFLTADISFNAEKGLEIESKFSIGNSIYFGVKITGTVQNRVHIMPYPRIGWLFGSDFYAEPGTSIEITCPLLRMKAFNEYDNAISMWASGYSVQYTEIE